MVMDVSWGWVKPGSVTTTEPRAKAMLELARLAIPQVMCHPIAGTRPELVERRERGAYQRLRLPAFRAWRSDLHAPAFVWAGRDLSIPWRARSEWERRLWFCRLRGNSSKHCLLLRLMSSN